ncbi:MAG: hypothetical protein AAFR87_21750 [Bacteroidota bacterium]
MKQNLLFKILVGTMVVLNLVLLAFIFGPNILGPGKHRPPGKPIPELVADILDFSEAQKDQYKKMGRRHHQAITRLQRKKDDAVVNFLKASTRDSVDKSLDTKMEKILEVEKERILLTYQHLEDIKNLCNDEQLKNFSKVINAMFRTPSGGRRPGGPHGPGGPPGPRMPPGD